MLNFLRTILSNTEWPHRAYAPLAAGIMQERMLAKKIRSMLQCTAQILREEMRQDANETLLGLWSNGSTSASSVQRGLLTPHLPAKGGGDGGEIFASAPSAIASGELGQQRCQASCVAH
jgi:hypothetical protein